MSLSDDSLAGLVHWGSIVFQGGAFLFLFGSLDRLLLDVACFLVGLRIGGGLTSTHHYVPV
jgi:hypothetical protein